MTNTNKPFAMFFNASPRKGWNTAKMLEAAEVLLINGSPRENGNTARARR